MPHDGSVLGREHEAGREVGDRDETGVEPFPVGVLGRQRRLHLGVVDDAPGGGVHEEHPARREAASLHDVGGLDVQHAHLGGEHDEAFVGHPVAGGTEAVAVENGAHEPTVAEGDRCRPVPRLHERRVVLVERPHVRVQLLVILPCLRDHHEDGMRQGATPEVEELEHLVEGGRVAGARGDDGEDAAEIPSEELRAEEGLPGTHPVAVALQRVDLAVVGDEPVGVGERPGREGVRREARMHEGEGRLEALVGEVREEVPQLVGREHALVDEGAGREGGEVEPDIEVLGPLAQHEEAALEVHRVGLGVGGTGHEHLGEDRGHAAGVGARHLEPDGHVPPTGHGEPLLGGEALEGGLRHPLRRRRRGQEGEAGAVLAEGRQLDGALGGDVPEEPVRHLQEDAGSVARLGVGAEGPPVGKVLEGGQPELDDGVARAATKLGYESDPTGIVLIGGVVKARRLTGWRHGVPSRSLGRSLDQAVITRDILGPLWVRPDYTGPRTPWQPAPVTAGAEPQTRLVSRW